MAGTRRLMENSAPDKSGGTVTNSTPSWTDLLNLATTFATNATQKTTPDPPQVVTVQAPAPTLSDYLKKPEVVIGGGLVLVLVLVLALRH